MADSLRRLTNIGSFSTLQDKLERWLDVYHVSTDGEMYLLTIYYYSMAKHSAEVQKIYTVMGPAAHMPVAMQISELEHVLQNAVF